MEDIILFIIIGVGVVMDTATGIMVGVIVGVMEDGMVVMEDTVEVIVGMGNNKGIRYYFWLVCYFILYFPIIAYWFVYREILYIRLFIMDWFGF